MRRVLATERRARLCHHGLDEAVADARADRRAAVLADDLRYGFRADAVVEDRRPGLAAEHRLGHDRGRGRTGDGNTLVVDEEDTVGVSVERETDVGARFADARDQRTQVLGLDRVGRMVRKRAVELAVHDLEIERQRGEHDGHHKSAHAVGRVSDDLQRLQLAQVDERANMRGKGFEQVLVRQLALVPCRRNAGFGHRLDLEQAGVDAHRLGAGQTKLDAVVLRRVVRGGEHRARRVQRAGRVVNEVGRGHPQIDDIHALRADAVGEGKRQLHPRRPHVPGHQHPRRGPRSGRTRPRSGDTSRRRGPGARARGCHMP